MEANNITAAPQVASVSTFYDAWRKTNTGNVEKFYKFLTTPSIERDEFFRSAFVDTEFAGAVLTETARVSFVALPSYPNRPDITVTPTLK